MAQHNTGCYRYADAFPELNDNGVCNRVITVGVSVSTSPPLIGSRQDTPWG